ncbi:tRNA pseudouridine(55) synthase TruB [Lysobacteraceae bacterium NML120232]|nr:tRNA pseudouridine(55) synthase TruB [Xanthomonadaceae bacterium NML120232]
MSQPRTRHRFRKLHGILLLDKPSGPSSNQALQKVRHLFRAEKAGHTGALDPLATGLLPICFGEATKIAGHLLGARKAYETVARLGITTDTDDAEGQVLRQRPVPVLNVADINSALAKLTGRIQQVPPIYSALKRGGEPLYVKARRGESIELDAREVEVQQFSLQSAHGLLDDAPTLRLAVECGSGTYVRSLVRDLGELLGCGAHVVELRRLWVEPFSAPRMWTLDALQALAEQGDAALEACLLPIEAGLAAWPKVHLEAEQAQKLGQGQTLKGGFAPSGDVIACDMNGRALGIAWVDEVGSLRSKRLFSWAAVTGQAPDDNGLEMGK